MHKYVKGVDRYTFAKITPYDEKVPGNQSSSMYMFLHKINPIQSRAKEKKVPNGDYKYFRFKVIF